MPRYCVDSNVLIEAKNGAYAFDLAPGFWSWLDVLIDRGELYCPAFVYDELIDRQDELSTWIKKRNDGGMVAEAGTTVQAQYRRVANYVSQTYTNAFAQPFLAGADPWVIAHGIADASIVVTQETMVNANSKNGIIHNRGAILLVGGTHKEDTFIV